jgi:1-acyl-sn-glycerol-3-phosphate acyltransferase
LDSSINTKKQRESKFELLVRRVYIIWAGAWWFFGFMLLLPLFTLCILIPSLRILMPAINTLWCWLFFPMAFLKVKTIGQNHIPAGPCIYISNHGSYLDIPLLTYTLPGFPAFMGKASLGKIPVFGFMFRNLHIVVDRNSSRGRAKAMKDSLEMLQSKRSIVIFPEGGIHFNLQPGLASFKEGAFSLAVQTGLPIVPVTICYNWYILPDDGRWLPRNGVCKSIIHNAIPTKGLSEKDIPELRDQCWKLIAETLEREVKNGPAKYRHPG